MTPDDSLDFRREAVDTIYKCIMAGESCALVGIGSVGKSRLLRHLAHDDVRRAQCGPLSDHWLLVYVDVNKQLEVSMWGLIELLLHQLFIAASERGLNKSALDSVDDLHERASASATRHLALRYLDRALSLVCSRLDLRVAFLIDEFERLCGHLSPEDFSALRALRDDHKYRLTYVLAMRRELALVQSEIAEIETFEELIGTTIWLSTYDEADAIGMLQQFEARQGIVLSEAMHRDLLHETGGHPGLLRSAFLNVMASGDAWKRDESHLLADECRRIWMSLMLDEQSMLTRIALKSPLPASGGLTLTRLRRKGLLLTGADESSSISVPLLAESILRDRPAVGATIYVDEVRRVMWVEGEIKHLTPLEYKLVAFMADNMGKVCSRDQLSVAVYGHAATYGNDVNSKKQGVNDAAIDSIVKRVRQSIEPNPQQPQYLLTERGVGFRLVDGRDAEGPKCKIS